MLCTHLNSIEEKRRSLGKSAHDLFSTLNFDFLLLLFWMNDDEEMMASGREEAFWSWKELGSIAECLLIIFFGITTESCVTGGVIPLCPANTLSQRKTAFQQGSVCMRV